MKIMMKFIICLISLEIGWADVLYSLFRLYCTQASPAYVCFNIQTALRGVPTAPCCYTLSSPVIIPHQLSLSFAVDQFVQQCFYNIDRTQTLHLDSQCSTRLHRALSANIRDGIRRHMKAPKPLNLH